MVIPLIVFGILMTVGGIYLLVKKSMFGEGDKVIEALNLGKKAVKRINIIMAIFYILFGGYILLYGIASVDPFGVFCFISR